MKIYGVVVWYNPDEQMKENISSYIKYIDKLIIIDNSSSINTYPKDKKIEYVFNNENLGISKALNMAAKICLKDKVKWLLTLDQDTVLNKECFLMFKDVVNNTDTRKIGIITPWHNTKLDVIKPSDDIDYPLDVMTSGNLVNVDVLKKLGFFNEDFFIDGVDIEYGLRLNSNGYKIMRNNTVEIIHSLGDINYHNFLGKKLLSHNHNYLRQYYMARNYRYIYRKYKNVYPEFCKRLIKKKQNIFVILFYEKDKYRKLKYIFKGIKDYKKNVTGRIEM